MNQDLKIRVVNEDGALWATVEEMPGLFATGDTMDELRESLEEGIALYLAEADGPTPTVHLGDFREDTTVTEGRAHLALA